MVARVVATLWIHTARGTFWVLEQPANSLLQHHPRWSSLFPHPSPPHPSSSSSAYTPPPLLPPLAPFWRPRRSSGSRWPMPSAWSLGLGGQGSGPCGQAAGPGGPLA